MAKKKTSFGCLFWLAMVLLVIVVFLSNQKNIQEVIKKTGFMEHLEIFLEPFNFTFNNNNDNNDNIENPQPVEPPEDMPNEITIHLNDDRENPENNNTTNPNPVPVISEPVENTNSIENSNDSSPNYETQEEKPNLRRANIYFVQIDSAGNISLEQVTRSVHYKDSPLTETIYTLLNGQLTSEINKGLLTMIPKNTKLNNIYIKGDTAYLDFSDNFMFNPMGQEGLKFQLMQIIYTTTEFSNINQVQLLINGIIKEYLSTEGIYVGKPLSRDSFSN